MIGASLELKGDEILLAASRKFQKAVPRTALNAVRRVLRRAITVIKKDMRGTSEFGRNVWGRGGTGPDLNKLVTLIRARATADTIVTGIKLRGLPRLLEEGGRTRAHVIRPREASRLAFKIGGRLILAKVVNHPGAQVRAHGYARAVMPIVGPAAKKEVREAIAKLRAETFGQHA